MKIFISGGCKNGKSTHAQNLAVKNKAASAPLYYIATMIPRDSEDVSRIERHLDDRKGMGFETVEINRNIEKILDKCDISGSFLLDSTTALLANEMFSDGGINLEAGEKICAGLTHIMSRINNLVIVSDYIYSDAMEYDELTEEYRRSLAKIDRVCVEGCDVVLEAVCGNFIVHKGAEEYGKII